MGSGSSQDQRDPAGSCQIQTDLPFYIAGDTVTGKVYVNMIENFPSNEVILKIKGYEKSKWSEKRRRVVYTIDHGRAKTRNEYYHNFHDGKNTFFNNQFPLYQWDTKYIPAGQYTFPFQFLLDNRLPGSYSEKGIHCNLDYQANIKYKVKALIKCGRRIIKEKQILIVREPLKIQGQDQYGEEIIKPTTWSCIKQGQSIIKCRFKQNNYCPGETANMVAEIDNSECDLPINTLECTFSKTLNLKSKFGHEAKVHQIISTENFGGCPAKKTAMGGNRRQVNIELVGEEGQSIQPSTQGQLVNCNYFLKVGPKLGGCTCSFKAQDIEVPITLFSKPPVNYESIQAPSDWNPQVFDIKNIVLSYDYIYQQYINVNGIQQPQMYAQQVPPPQILQNYSSPVQENASISTNLLAH